MNALITGLADFALAATCLVCSWKLWSQSAPRKDLNRNFFGVFTATAVAAIAGGLRHSYPAASAVHMFTALSASVLIFAGVAAYNVWLIDVQLLLGEKRSLRISRWVFRILLVIYLATVWHHGHTFLTALAAYLPPTTVLFVIAFLRAMRAKNRFYFLGVAGLLVCFVAAGIEVSRFQLNSVYLTSDVLYDVFEGLGLWGVYLFGSRVSRLKSL